jgi:hypothetical protein
MQSKLFPDPEHEDLNPLPGWLRMNFDTMQAEVYLGEGKWINLQTYYDAQLKGEDLIKRNK